MEIAKGDQLRLVPGHGDLEKKTGMFRAQQARRRAQGQKGVWPKDFLKPCEEASSAGPGGDPNPV